MTREMLITELNNRGYQAEAQNVIKNGVELEGIRFLPKHHISPIIYTEAIIRNAEDEDNTLDEVVSAIINTYESHKSLNFNADCLYDKDFILNSIYIGLQRAGSEDIVKRTCGLDGIESYLYIRGVADRQGSYSIKISESILQHADISADEAWARAEVNTFSETCLESMAKVMANMMGLDYSEEMDMDIPLYVVSNTSKVKGASGILNKKLLSDFGKRYDTDKIIVMGSSIHEMLIVPYTEELSLDTFSEMVRDVNPTVDPTERLTDRAYIINL